MDGALNGSAVEGRREIYEVMVPRLCPENGTGFLPTLWRKTTQCRSVSLLHNNWGVEDVQAIIRLASRAEELGFASVSVYDHVFNAGHVFISHWEQTLLRAADDPQSRRSPHPTGGLGHLGARAGRIIIPSD